MWGNYGMGFMWWLWPIGLLLLAGVVLLTILTVRAFSPGNGHRDSGGQRPVESYPVESHRPARSAARQLLDERFARGELDSEEYRHRIQVLDE